MSRALLAAALALLAARPAPAHELLNLPATDGAAPRHRVYVVSGFDPTFVTGIGYAYALPVVALGRTVELSIDLSAPWFVLDGQHGRLDVGGRSALLRSGGFGLLGRLHLTLSRGQNWVHTATGLGFETSLVTGWFRPRWHVAAEWTAAHATLTRLVHSEIYRRSQYDDVVDGWYWGTGGRLALALEGSLRVTPRWELGLRLGAYRSLALAAPQGLPAFADLAVTAHF